MKQGGLVITVAVFCLLAFFLSSCRADSLPGFVAGQLAAGEKAVRIKHLERADVPAVYVLSDSGNTPVKMLLVCETEGYNDLIRLCVALDLQEQKILSVSILEHQESDNYGAYAAEEWFLARFAGKPAAKDLQVVKMAAKNREDIVAVTGATVTSAAVVSGVNRALAVCREYGRGE
ncbi:MAG: FMN-binding protein [Firmicutes bacterium]|nr:FMN-binding protein [Bacillota bacterium]